MPTLKQRAFNKATQCFGHQLKDRTRRLIFMSSLCARIDKEKSLNRHLLNKINSVMSLASGDETALCLCSMLSGVIWQGQDSLELCRDDPLDPNLSDERASKIASNIVSAMPKWLHYSVTWAMEKDVVTLLRHRRDLVTQAT